MKFNVTDKGKESKAKHDKNVKRGKNSRNKGASYERKIAKFLEGVFGIEFVRTPQSGGFAKNKTVRGNDFCGDIIPVNELTEFNLHIECKNTQTWSLPSWFKQAESDCPEGKKPCVIFHKYNTDKDYIAMSLSDFLSIVDKEKIIGEGVKRQ